MAKEKENIWNVPNLLTMIRMALIPVYWILFMQPENYFRYIALGVFILASLTDLADGYIARKYNLITSFGKLMDPLADKLMVLSVMLSLALKGLAPWPALVILLAKEATMVLGGVILYRMDVVVYAIKIGKYAQALVVTALLSCFFGEWFVEKGILSAALPLHRVLVWCAVALTLCALGVYTSRAINLYREAKAKKADG
ncbi:MAG: CDP-diacylglycerol--glycerol-3-phosphate 3-phosphatidyltransferase [Clostridia bacterium]|nr:CDP-diacylglycerol--glycerol-3-phosphate 3-phosphatidyltransferase [Clostridia bacterium]